VGNPDLVSLCRRRVESAEHGAEVEQNPRNNGKRPGPCVMMGLLVRWALRLSWQETAQVSHTSWESAYRSVECLVRWGLALRKLQGLETPGVDVIPWGHGLRPVNFPPVIYQIDALCRRLL
jgi:hypothetical protein